MQYFQHQGDRWGFKTFSFRDSLQLLTLPLRDLPAAFLTPEQRARIRKEEFPYTYYTASRYAAGVGSVREAATHCRDSQRFIDSVTAFSDA